MRQCDPCGGTSANTSRTAAFTTRGHWSRRALSDNAASAATSRDAPAALETTLGVDGGSWKRLRRFFGDLLGERFVSRHGERFVSCRGDRDRDRLLGDRLGDRGDGERRRRGAAAVSWRLRRGGERDERRRRGERERERRRRPDDKEDEEEDEDRDRDREDAGTTSAPSRRKRLRLLPTNSATVRPAAASRKLPGSVCRTRAFVAASQPPRPRRRDGAAVSRRAASGARASRARTSRSSSNSCAST